MFLASFIVISLPGITMSDDTILSDPMATPFCRSIHSNSCNCFSNSVVIELSVLFSLFSNNFTIPLSINSVHLTHYHLCRTVHNLII